MGVLQVSLDFQENCHSGRGAGKNRSEGDKRGVAEQLPIAIAGAL